MSRRRARRPPAPTEGCCSVHFRRRGGGGGERERERESERRGSESSGREWEGTPSEGAGARERKRRREREEEGGAAWVEVAGPTCCDSIGGARGRSRSGPLYDGESLGLTEPPPPRRRPVSDQPLSGGCRHRCHAVGVIDENAARPTGGCRRPSSCDVLAHRSAGVERPELDDSFSIVRYLGPDRKGSSGASRADQSMRSNPIRTHLRRVAGAVHVVARVWRLEARRASVAAASQRAQSKLLDELILYNDALAGERERAAARGARARGDHPAPRARDQRGRPAGRRARGGAQAEQKSAKLQDAA